MGKVTTFKIVVNGGETVKAGDTLTGHVRLELREDLRATAVRISFTGQGNTQWAQTQKSSPMPEMSSALVDPVVAQEVYFSQPLSLWPRDSDSETTTSQPSLHQPTQERKPATTLTKGTHRMDFEFHVPDSSPSSFRGLNGLVQYQLKAVIALPVKRGVKGDVVVTTHNVTVSSHLDLNDFYDARESVHLTRDLKSSVMLLPSVDCHATMRLPRKGFVQGEAIPVELSVHNNSNHAIQSVSLVLKMVITYKAGEKKCLSECVMDKIALGKVPAHKTLEGTDKELRVPVTCQPSGLPGCSLIDITYNVELKVKPSSLTLKRLKLHSEVIVGTMPLTASGVHDTPPDYWSCCLPSYEEIMALAPPPYTPQTLPSSGVNSPVAVTQARSRLAVTPQNGSLQSRADILPSFIKDTVQAVSWENLNSLVFSDRNPSAMMLVQGFL